MLKISSLKFLRNRHSGFSYPKLGDENKRIGFTEKNVGNIEFNRIILNYLCCIIKTNAFRQDFNKSKILIRAVMNHRKKSIIA